MGFFLKKKKGDQGQSARCPHMVGVMAFFFFYLCLYVCKVFHDCDLLLHN